MARLEKRDRVYRQLLSLCPLSPDHLAHLMGPRRGLEREEIEDLGYGTAWAQKGGPREQEEKAFSLGGSLAVEHEDLETVPGFGPRLHFSNKPGVDIAAAISLTPRIMIPIRTTGGSIQGFQLLDPAPDCDPKRRYVWLSGVGDRGASIGKPLHCARPCREYSTEFVYLTEGPLKADIIAQQTGSVCLAFQGIRAIDMKALEKALHGLDPSMVILALDADKRRNKDVLRAQADLIDFLHRAGHDYRIADWPEEDGKGLDDLLLAGGEPELLDPRGMPEEDLSLPDRRHTELSLVCASWSDASASQVLASFGSERWQCPDAAAGAMAISSLVEQGLEVHPQSVSGEMQAQGTWDRFGALREFEAQNAEHLKGSAASIAARNLKELCAWDDLEAFVLDLSSKIRQGNASRTASEVLDRAAELVASSRSERCKTLSDHLDELMAAWEEGREDEGKFSLGMPGLVDYIGLAEPGQMYVLCGPPKTGKSSYVDGILERVAQDGIPCLLGQLEMSAREICKRAISRKAGVPIDELTLEDAANARASGALDFMSRIFLTTKGTTLDEYKTEVHGILAENSQIKLLATDYAEQIQKFGAAFNATSQTEEISSWHKNVAKSFQIVTIVLVQPTKEYTKDRPSEPSLHYLKNSGKWEQDASAVIFLHSPHRFNKEITRQYVEAHVLCARHGKPGVIPYRWTPETYGYRAWDGPAPAGVGRNLAQNCEITDTASRLKPIPDGFEDLPLPEIDWADLA